MSEYRSSPSNQLWKVAIDMQFRESAIGLCFSKIKNEAEVDIDLDR